MSNSSVFGFYGILTNPTVGYEELTRVMVDKNVKIIQLRMKEASHDQVRDMAQRLRRLIPAHITYIINDDPQIAIDCDADGVHLGQTDMAYADARRLLGPKATIGISTHNSQQTRDACTLNPDYIGIGPVYATPTKKIPDPVLGIAGMQQMLAVATVPAVCLGGIDHDNVSDVLAGGAKNICAVRCINASKNPGRELDRMMATISAQIN